MNSAELKLELIRKIDQLDRKQLNELSGVIDNMIHGKYGEDDWDKLSLEEQNGILEAIEDIQKNGGIEHKTVMKNIRTRIANA